MNKEVQDYEFAEATSLDSGREISDSGRGSEDQQHSKRGVRRYGIRTGQFYAWEKLARQGVLEALRNGKRGRKKTKQEAALQSEIIPTE